jgi:phage terminase large subunit
MSDIVEQAKEPKYANKFFKLKIEKLLSRILNEEGKPVVFNESQWDMVKGLEENRFWVHIAGRRTGKSFGAATLALAKLLEPNTHVAVVAPNYNLSTIIWDYISNFIRQLGLETERFSTKDRVIVLSNGSVFRLLSVANRETLVGRGYHLVIIDEAAIIEDDGYFVRDIRPTLATYDNTRCLFISTPRGKHNYLFEYFNRGQPDHARHAIFPDWGSGIYPWWTNPRLNKSDIDEARNSMTKTLFAQEYECSWTSFENMIYNIHEESICTNLLDEIRKRKMDFIAGLDIGFRDETACVVIATDYLKYYIVDEYVVNETVTSDIASCVKELEQKYDLQAIYIDSAAQQMRADLANDYDIYCENALKDVETGIGFIQNLFEKKLLLVDKERCPKTLAALEQYKWKGNTLKPTPVHDWTSHCSDAVRYAIYSHQKNQAGIFTA